MSPNAELLARELEGALVNSDGEDFHIRADFVREVIDELRGPFPDQRDAANQRQEKT